MNLKLRIWRQQSANASGTFVIYQVNDVTPDMSFLEMLDALNEDLINQGDPPVAFEHDCREGICGSCGFLINGVAHGGQRGTTVCQLAMRFFKNGDTITLEPWRARAFPVIRDLIVNRSAFDRIIQSGGFITVPTGSAPDANAVLVPKEDADTAFDAAAGRRQAFGAGVHEHQDQPMRIGHGDAAMHRYGVISGEFRFSGEAGQSTVLHQHPYAYGR